MQFQPGILSLINSAAQQHGVDPNALQRIAWLESRGNPAAKNANSSASGLFQFINSTAKQYGLNDPFDAAASADAGARFARDNARHLRNRLGRDPSAGELYLAHQQGPGGAVKLLSNPNARAVDVVGADAVRLNGGNENMTAGEFANLWINKAGGTVNTFAGGDYTPPENPQPIGGSTMQQGLLNMIQQEDTRTLGQRVKDGAKDGSLWDALAMGFNTMRGPMADQGLAQSVGARMDQRQQTQQKNQTAEWLAANGRQDLAEALVNGMISGDQAFAAMQPQQIEGKVVGDRLVNPYTGEVIGDYTTEQQFQTLTGEQAAAMGLDPAQAYNLGPDGRITQIGSGGVTVNNNMGQDKFAEAFAKGDADALGAISESGMAAQRNMSRIDQLEALLNESPSGFGAIVAQKAGEWGINTEGLDTVQAAQAMINSLVPEQRQPGSGPMSDADLELFKQSLPRLINQPGGNQRILNSMRAIAQYDAEGATIVQQLRAGEIDRATAFERLQSRRNPLEGFAAASGADPAPQPGNDISDDDLLKKYGG